MLRYNEVNGHVRRTAYRAPTYGFFAIAVAALCVAGTIVPLTRYMAAGVEASTSLWRQCQTFERTTLCTKLDVSRSNCQDYKGLVHASRAFAIMASMASVFACGVAFLDHIRKTNLDTTKMLMMRSGVAVALLALVTFALEMALLNAKLCGGEAAMKISGVVYGPAPWLFLAALVVSQALRPVAASYPHPKIEADEELAKVQAINAQEHAAAHEQPLVAMAPAAKHDEPETAPLGLGFGNFGQAAVSDAPNFCSACGAQAPGTPYCNSCGHKHGTPPAPAQEPSVLELRRGRR